MPGTSLIVFDLDGTLVDTAPDLLATLNVVLAEAGYGSVSREQLSHLVGQGARKMLERGLEANGIETTDSELNRLFERFIAYYSDHIADHSRPFPHVLDAIAELKGRGFRFAVCTNKLESLSIRLLDALGIADLFDSVAGRDTFPVFKPDPGHLTGTIDKAGGDPARSVLIGDSRTDIATAKAAGIPVIAVSFGYSDVPVADLAPTTVIDDFRELPTAVAALDLIG